MDDEDVAEMYDLEKYEQSEENEDVYVLKDEYKLWDYDENAGEFIFHFTMSFDDLKG